MLNIRQSTTISVKIGPYLDSTDGNSQESGLTIANTDVKLSKNGGTFASKNSGGGTYDTNGFYTISLNPTDTDTVGLLQLSSHVTGALAVYHELQVLEEALYDAIYAASAARIPADLTHIGGAAVNTGSAQLGVNVVNAAGTGWTSGAITAAVIAADAIGASELATDAVHEIAGVVWGATTRILTAGTNIALAKGTGVTGFNDLDAAGVRSAVGLASANLDTQLTAIDDFLDTEIAAIKAKTDNLPTDPADASDIATATNAISSALVTIDDFLDTEIAAIKVSTDRFLTMIEVDSGSTYKLTAAALASAPTGGLDAAGVRDALGLASANLDTQLGTIDTVVDAILVDTGTDIPASLIIIDDFLDTEVAAIKAKTDNLPSDPADQSLIIAATDAIAASIAGLNNLSAAQVNSEVVDALNVDTYAEPGQGAPGATISIAGKVGYLYKIARNKLEQGATEFRIYADNGTTVDHKATVSDDGTTFTRGELITGA